jgi:hypothetical protein
MFGNNSRKIFPFNDQPKIVEPPKTNQSTVIDDLVDSVNNEVDKITSEIEDYALMFGSKQANERLAKQAEQQSSNNVENNNLDFIAVANHEIIAEEDEKEEINLSHEVYANYEEITNELIENFHSLKKQVEEYRNLYKSSAEKFKESQNKLNELETKLTECDDEKHSLEEQLRLQQTQNNNNNNNNFQRNNSTNYNNNSLRNNNANTSNRAEELRRALLLEVEEENVINFDSLLQSQNLAVAIKQFLSQFDPFKRDITNIQARFGSSVASYFSFYRYLINQFLGASIFALIFLAYHCYYLYIGDQHYSPLDYLEATGFMPQIFAVSSFSVQEALYYDLVIIFMQIWIFGSIFFKFLYEDRLMKHIVAIENENLNPYSKLLLANWDFSRIRTVEIEEYSGSVCNQLLAALEESLTKGITKSRSRYETFVVISRRVTGNFLFLLTIVISFAIILYVTIYGNEIAGYLRHFPGLSNINSIVVPIILNLVNSALPTILKMITDKEAWDSAQTISNITLFRLYLASTLNALLLIVSYLVLADPFLLAQYPQLRDSFGLKVNRTSFACRLDQVAEGLFTLVGFTWFIDEAIFLLTPLCMQYLYRFFHWEYKKDEFDVASSMVKRLGFIGLIFASLPFCPSLILFVPIFLVIGFKYEKQVIKYYYSKPKRQWQGQSAGLVYIAFYCTTFVLIGLSVSAYFFSSKTFPKNCNIQDASIQLCKDEVGSLGDNICTTNTNSKYYSMYSNDYPASICEYACGPFIRSATNLAPLQSSISSVYGLSILWAIFFANPYISWILVIVLTLVLGTKDNSIEVNKVSATSKERSLETQIISIEAERKKQEKILKRLQSIEETNIQSM